MRTFNSIFEKAVARTGNKQILLELLAPLKNKNSYKNLADADFLEEMAKCVFRSGFVWKVIEKKWPGFRIAFNEFDIMQCAMLSEEELDRLMKDTRIVRHRKKIESVRSNAQLIYYLRDDYRSFSAFLSQWPENDFVSLWEYLKKNGSRLGGQTGRYFLRFVGFDAPLLTKDVCDALIANEVIDKPPTSKKALLEVQDAFNSWQQESSFSFAQISRVLAISI